MKKLVLKNIQKHKKLIINFGDITAIRGANDNGKSTIIRAIYWILYDKPSGDWMRRILPDGKLATAHAKLYLKDGNVIERVKGDKINRYVLNGVNYDNYGTIPEDIQKVLNTPISRFGNKNFTCNVFMQDDNSFVVEESPSVKADMINQLTGANIVHRAVKRLNKEKREYTTTLKVYSEELDNAKLNLKSLHGTERIIKRFESIEKRRDKLEQSKVLYKRMVDVNKSYCRLRRILRNNKSTVNTFTVDPDILLKKAEIVIKMKKELENLEKVYKQIIYLEKIINIYKEMETVTMDELSSKVKIKEDLEDKYGKIRQISEKYNKLSHKIGETKKEIKKLQKKLSEFEGKACVLCGKIMDRESLIDE